MTRHKVDHGKTDFNLRQDFCFKFYSFNIHNAMFPQRLKSLRLNDGFMKIHKRLTTVQFIKNYIVECSSKKRTSFIAYIS